MVVSEPGACPAVSPTPTPTATGDGHINALQLPSAVYACGYSNFYTYGYRHVHSYANGYSYGNIHADPDTDANLYPSYTFTSSTGGTIVPGLPTSATTVMTSAR